MDCLFCKIAEKKISADVIYENDKVIIFKDIEPKAPVHLLVIPKLHINSLNDVDTNNCNIINEIFLSIVYTCKKIGLSSYRIVNNCGSSAGQTVNHIHFHILGGRNMNWPPG